MLLKKEMLNINDEDLNLVDWSIEDLQKLSKRINKKNKKSNEHDFIKIAVLSGGLTSFICEVLNLFFLERNLKTKIYEAPFGTILTEVLEQRSQYHQFNPDITVMIPTLENIQYFNCTELDEKLVKKSIDKEISIWKNIWKLIKGEVVQFTFYQPELRPLGEADGLYPGGFSYYIRKLNEETVRQSRSNFYFIDMDFIQFNLTKKSFHDPRLNSMIRQPYAMEAIPIICSSIANGVCVHLKKTKKALIIDLDNTIWGGTIGDDGLEGILLDSNNTVGQSFIEFQKFLKALSLRGVPLAVCSKNDINIAKDVFKNHPGMVLKEDDIACFVANFNNKADNIRNIAKSLNLNLDSLVFADDSIVECELVKQELFQVEVVHLSGDPAFFSKKIEIQNYFATSRIVKEDLIRSQSYKAMQDFNYEISNSSNIDEFLKGLKPKLIIESITLENSNRICQLLGKTNQFKLNKNIYSYNEILDKKFKVIALNFKDRLQNYGIISVALLTLNKKTLFIKNWVMSCRVFNRRIEFFMIEELVKLCRDNDISYISMKYENNNKNMIVLNLIKELGFIFDKNEKIYSKKIENIITQKKHYINS